MQNSQDDYSKIVDVLSRFAIHYDGLSFSCRKVCFLEVKNHEYFIYIFFSLT